MDYIEPIKDLRERLREQIDKQMRSSQATNTTGPSNIADYILYRIKHKFYLLILFVHLVYDGLEVADNLLGADNLNTCAVAEKYRVEFYGWNNSNRE